MSLPAKTGEAAWLPHPSHSVAQIRPLQQVIALYIMFLSGSSLSDVPGVQTVSRYVSCKELVLTNLGLSRTREVGMIETS